MMKFRFGQTCVGRALRSRRLAAPFCLLAISLAIACSAPAHALDAPVAAAVIVAHEAREDATSITIAFDKPVEVRHRLLAHPARLVLDFDKIGYGFDVDTASWVGSAVNMRWGDMSERQSRLIFEFDGPFAVTSINGARNSATGTYDLVVETRRSDAEAFQAAIEATLSTASVPNRSSKGDRLGAAPVLRNDTFTVVIDPGHGGIDSGAVGAGRTLEKDVTLSFSKTLAEKLVGIDDINVVMTRDRDVFVRLNERVRIARQHHASLFISVHADSVRQNYVRGSTVYTISDRASDAVAAALAEDANRSDAIAGLTIENEPEEVADILIDLTRRETLGFSVQFARIVLDEIKSVARLIKNPHRFAGFRVLKAPDVPSILLELGYLSNADDEKLLQDPVWRNDMADRMVDSILRFADLSGSAVARNN